ncbi:MAG: alpha/beta hydrolase [Planctomycetota bacterium]
MTDKKICFLLLVLLVCVGFSLTVKTFAQSDVADVSSKSLFAQGDKNKRYFLIGADEQIKEPKDGFGLVIVLPGGDGGPGFNPFVKRIYKNALSKKYLVAQLVSVKWTSKQNIVWPTEKVKVDKQKFSTEEFVEAVVKDIKTKYKLNEQHIFTLSWSSGGPAAYAISLQKEKSVTGSYIVMSVFKPNSLGPLEQAAGHAYLIEHSPDDKVCPFWMARKAYQSLRENGAKVKFVKYKGGHGWKGNISGRIRSGVRWLESGVQTQKRGMKPMQTQQKRAKPSNSFPVIDGFETGVAAPAGWRKGANIQGVEYIWDKNFAFKGNKSLCLKKTAKRFFPIAQWSKKFAYDRTSQGLQVSAQIKAKQATKAIIDVQFLGANRKQLSHKWAVYIGAQNSGDPPANHDWKGYSGIVPVPNGTKAIVIALQIYGPGTIWFDELTADYVKLEEKQKGG